MRVYPAILMICWCALAFGAAPKQECEMEMSAKAKLEASKKIDPEGEDVLVIDSLDDLNGDKKKDMTVTFDWACGAHNCDRSIFVSKGACWQHVGNITGSLTRAEMGSKNGVESPFYVSRGHPDGLILGPACIPPI